jgi:hypothetical protein
MSRWIVAYLEYKITQSWKVYKGTQVGKKKKKTCLGDEKTELFVIAR